MYDGGDLFQLAGSNDAFLGGLHKVGADWTAVAFATPISEVTNVILNTQAGNPNIAVGTTIRIGTTGTIGVITGNGSLGTADISAATLPSAAEGMCAVGLQLISNTSRKSLTYVNGTYEPETETSSFSLSASAANRARIGATGNGSVVSGNGTKIHALAMFNKMLSQAELDAMRASCLRRWPMI